MLARIRGKAAAPAEATPILPTAPSAEQLKAQRSEIEAQLRTLTKERDTLSLASLSGDASAVTAIEGIDRDRQRLAGQVETLTAALRDLANQRKQLKLVDLPNLPREQAYLKMVVRERRENICFNIERGTYRHRRADEIAHNFDHADPFTVAKAIVGTHVKRETMFWEHNASAAVIAAARKQQAENDIAREREISRLAQELVASVELPPMPEAMQALLKGREYFDDRR